MAADSILRLAQKKFSSSEFLRIQKAYDLSKKSHVGQLRKSGEDYFYHPIKVTEILLKWDADYKMIIAALLHDSVEDSTLTVHDVQKMFDVEVATYVFALTKHFFTEGVSQSSISFLKEAPKILIIKLADRLHNMRTLSSMSSEKRALKSVETLSVYVPVARYFKMYDVADELKELAEKWV